MAAAPSLDGFYLARIATPRPPDPEHEAWHAVLGDSDHDHEDEAIILAIFRGGVVVGADPGGCRYDGTLTPTKDGRVAVRIRMVAMPDLLLFGEVPTGPDGADYDFAFTFEAGVLEGAPVTIETPGGPATLRLEKLRDL